MVRMADVSRDHALHNMYYYFGRIHRCLMGTLAKVVGVSGHDKSRQHEDTQG